MRDEDPIEKARLAGMAALSAMEPFLDGTAVLDPDA